MIGGTLSHNTIATWLDWDWDTAEREFRRTLELDPNYADARVFYGLCLTAMGRHDEARAQMERGVELDPHSAMFQTYLGVAHFRARLFDEAMAQYRKGLSLDPNFASARGGLYRVYHGLSSRQSHL